MSILASVQYDLAAGVLVLLVVFAARTIYGVYFGPLSKFPGPKIAAATLCYEFYYDIILQGQYTFKIRELHEKYGLSHSFQITPNKEANNLSLEAQLFELVLTSFILMNPTTMKNCILINRGISIPSLSRNSVFLGPVSRLSTTNSTEFAATLSVPSSQNRMSIIWNR
jgi:hypothetical protein